MITIIRLRKEELKKNITIIQYSFTMTPFGIVILASTKLGICYIAFVENEEDGKKQLISKFPDMEIIPGIDDNQENAIVFFKNSCNPPTKMKLHLLGTDFQVKVWEALLDIPFGKLTTYSAIANNIGQNRSYRAVGTAIGNNPIAVIIPCHRVVQSTGKLGGYRWGIDRKKVIIASESV
ncbi:MAG: methylated-DNA--[protein]-cysteine S-methyltransferase [Bacteroidetes bacterium]|nr:methylated-DNA--[protein]-cysteine S-methyltransferase [Bacteroidota bacterium]